MPIQIKISIIALVLSCLSMITGTVLECIDCITQFHPGMQMIVGISILWKILIYFLISNIRKKKSILATLYLIALITMYFDISDYLDYGFSYYQLFYIAEVIFIFISILFLSTKESKAWN